MGNSAVNLPYTEISLRGLKLCRRCCRYRKLRDGSQNLKDGSQNLCARYCRLHWQKDGSLSTDGSQMSHGLQLRDGSRQRDGSQMFHGLQLRDGSRQRDGSQMFHGLQLRDGSRQMDVTGHGCKRVC